MDNFTFDDEMYIFHVNKKIEVIEFSMNTIKEEIQNSLLQNPVDLRSLSILAQIEYTYNIDYHKALNLIKEILILDNQNVDARIDLVEIMSKFKLKSPGECYQILDECLLIDETYWRINYVRSVILSDNMNTDDSIYILKKLIDVEPENVFILSRLSQFLSKNDYSQKESERLLKKVKLKSIYDYDILRRLSYTEFSLKNYEICKKMLERAIKLNPKSSICYENLAYYELKVENNKQKSEELYEKSIQYDDNLYEAHNQLATISIKKNDQEKSIHYFKRCIEIKNNRSSQPYTELAVIYSNKQQENISYYYIQKALKHFQTCPYTNLIAVMQRLEQPFRSKYEDLEEDELNSHVTLNNSFHQDSDYIDMNQYINIIY